MHLLRGILDGSILSDGTTIFSFLNAICKNHSIIHFVQRGTSIQEQYIALWPSEEYISSKAKEVLADIQDLYGISESDIERLEKFSRELIKIVRIIYSGDYRGNQMIQQINSLEQSFRESEWEFGSNPFNRRGIIELRSFENDISIVFQNKEDCQTGNLLFTGDFGYNSSLWKEIEHNSDGNCDCDMHSIYHAIKTGHHGTRRYYHSFVNRMNCHSVLMIPNDGRKMRWNICSDYSLNVITVGATVICSTDNACEAVNCNYGTCTCFNKNIIAPNIYYDIT